MQQLALASECFGARLDPALLLGRDETTATVADRAADLLRLPEGLAQIDPAELAERLPLRWEAYVEAVKAIDANRHVAEPKPLKELLAPEFVNGTLRALRPLNRLLDQIGDRALGSKGVLRDDQFDVFIGTYQFLEGGDTAGHFDLPTGWGKTVLFSQMVRAIGGRCLIVANTKDLTEQTLARFRRFAPELKIGLYYSKSKDLSGDVTITTYASLPGMVRSGLISGHDIDAVILDEGDEALGPKRSEIVKSLKEQTIVFAFSATCDGLDQLVGPCVHRISLPEGIAMGILCGVQAGIVWAKASMNDLPTVINKFGELDYQRSALEEFLAKPAIRQAGIKLASGILRNRKLIAFTQGVDNAIGMAEELKGMGIRAESVSGRDTDTERINKMEAYRRGEITQIFNDSVLVRGFDDNTIETGLFLAPTISERVAKQRTGRLTRADEDDPNRLTLGIDVVYSTSRRVGSQVLVYDVIGGKSRAVRKNFTGAFFSVPDLTAASERNERPVSTSEVANALAAQVELEVCFDEPSIVKVVSERDLSSFSAPLPGWLTVSDIARKLSVTRSRVERELDNLVSSRRSIDEPRFYLHGTKSRLHYSPRVVEDIAHRIEALKSRSDSIAGNPHSFDGWIPLGLIAKAHEISLVLARRVAALMKEEHPSLVANRHKLGIWIAPSIKEEIERRIRHAEDTRKKAFSIPAGWQNVLDWCTSRSLSPDAIYRLARSIPNWQSRMRKIPSRRGTTVAMSYFAEESFLLELETACKELTAKAAAEIASERARTAGKVRFSTRGASASETRALVTMAESLHKAHPDRVDQPLIGYAVWVLQKFAAAFENERRITLLVADGWRPVAEIRDTFSDQIAVVNQICERERTSQPSAFKLERNFQGEEVEMVNDQVATIIRSRVYGARGSGWSSR